MLRQCVRFCIDAEKQIKSRSRTIGVRTIVPKLLDLHKLPGKELGDRRPDDAWVDSTARFIFDNGGEQAMEAVAAALARGHPARRRGRGDLPRRQPACAAARQAQ